jgi:hypothetical protein
MQGQKNVYICTCGHGFVTVDRDEGVTPFMTTCQRPGCGKQATSLCYRVPQQVLADKAPVLEWYRPNETELDQAGEEIERSAFSRTGSRDAARAARQMVAEHVQRGGLLNRVVNAAALSEYEQWQYLQR